MAPGNNMQSEEPLNGANGNSATHGSSSTSPTKTRSHEQDSNGHANGSPAGRTATKSNDDDQPKPKESLLQKTRRIWLAKTGIDARTYMQLFKGALAPTIAIAAYQATAFADTYTTIGYLVGIMTILSLPIQPRAKFTQTMLINILVTCIGCCVALLAMFCTVHARIDTEGHQGPGKGGPGTSGLAAGGAATSTYNSSASAVAGIWLFVEIYAISAFRANRPQFTIPSILFAIFANVSMIYAPQFSTMTQASAFAQKLLEAFFTGFAISTGVSLFVFPLTSRQVVFKEMTGYFGLLRKAMKANLDYMHTLEETDMFAPHRINTAGDEVAGSKEADAFKATMVALNGLHSKLAADLVFAKREIALGKVGPDDLQQLFKHLRETMIPVLGLSSLSDIFQRIAEGRGWDRDQNFAHATAEQAPNESEKLRIESITEWHHLMKQLREPFGKATTLIDEGLEHALITLQLAPRHTMRTTDDAAEANGDAPQPGEAGFADYYKRRSTSAVDTRKEMLRSWCAVHGIELAPDFFDDPYRKDYVAPDWMNTDHRSPERQRLRRQLFLCLHMGFLLKTVNQRVGDLINYAEKLQASGKLSKTRLIVPGIKRLRKWFMSFFSHDMEAHDDQKIDSGDNGVTVYLGQAYKTKKDPEHLPPTNPWEKSSNSIRKIGHFFASPASSFGLRSVVAYLHDTQTFFTRERLFWSQIMISISMTPTAGQSVRGFLFRVFGTTVAMILAWIAYYIVDGKTAGILVFFFLFLHFGLYIVLKYPGYIPVGMISQVTMTLILGYELQVRKVGVAVATSNGQAYHPIYILGPIRLATVAGGLFLAWIWTVFPFPITEHSQLRQTLGKTLYLLANYYSVMHETVRARVRGCEADFTSKDGPGYKLDKARYKVFSKCTALLGGLQAQSAFVKFDLPIGGKFPHARYQSIIAQMRSTLNFMALVSLASSTFAELSEADASDKEHSSEWLRNFRRLLGESGVTSEAITTLLSLLSASVTSGTPLPPYLRVPEPYRLSQKLDELDQDLLSVRHIAEPGYASFAVMQIGTRCIINDLAKILENVKELVGELDFSYHVVSTNDSTRQASEETLVYPRTGGASGVKMD
ncbi:hypothetical protein LTR78_000682 [Recurvomyces mirabilis]|uniref:ER transporter 6TM N-terminal domain-containing protein n=1 Tax=Recurvomyces mirabilis TaxID=574656 RepID=A0AAE0WYA5_9PEZI|nr:hypothetical protein LTR78_000682 [Recurvomyces mirabilis]KAK5162336.1 hypothetical protein LTS14_000683 [Recurvomyces mirabilis]